MYPYLKELTLDEAKRLPLDAIVYSSYNNVHDLNGFYINSHYEQGNKLYCTALDYATHILGQTPPPEGYGYASKKLREGTYTGLSWGYYGEVIGKWELIEDGYYDNENSTENWNLLCFKLTDLARVEAQTDTEKTEINAAQVTDWEAKCKELEREKNQAVSIYANLQIDKQRNEKDLQNKIAALEAENKDLKEKSLGILGHVASNHIADQKMLNDRIAELEAKLNAELQNTIANNDAWIKANNELLDRLQDAQNCIKEQEQTIKEKDGNLISLMKAYEVTRSATLNLHCAQLDLTELLTRLDLNNL